MDVALLLIAFTLLMLALWYVPRATSKLNRAHYKKRWISIEKTMKIPDAGLRLAVIDADKLLDQALKQSRFKGESMGERLRSAEKSVKNYQNVWEAHKLRNRLVHEEVNLKKNQAQTAVSAFKSALKGLGAF